MAESTVKVLLQQGDHVESVWAVEVGAGRYRLDNSPFYAYGVSSDDVVAAQLDETGALRMTRVLEKSGHRTVRIHVPAGSTQAQSLEETLRGVNALGAAYEGANRTYLAIDVPPGIELGTVTDYLTDREVEWEYADPTYEDMQANLGVSPA